MKTATARASRVQRLKNRYYPDGCRNGTRAFYGWIREFTTPESVVLNIGAGPPTNDRTRTLKGEVARVVGVDIDSCVLENPELDDAHVYEVGGRFPFGDATFDLAISDFVLEHIERPLPFLHEVRRILKPGGSYFFRTPNRMHYIALIARMTPHSFHELLANRARGLPANAHEPWPTYYRMNSRRVLRNLATAAGFSRVELRMYEADPSYLVFHPLPFLGGVAYERLVNRFEALAGIRANIFGRFVH